MKRTIATFLMAVIIAGCGREETLPDNDLALAIIDGRPLTVGQVRDVVMVRTKMKRLAGAAPQGKALTNWMNSCAMQVLPGLVSAELLEAEIRRLGEKPDEADYANILQGYNKATRQKAKTLDELAAKFGEAEASFRRQAERSALFRAYNRRHAVKPATKDDLRAFYAGLTNQIETAKQIDALARRKADKAWKRLKAGEDWGKVAKECSEDRLVDEENAGFADEWATVGLDGMEYSELAKALPYLDTGDFSKPIEIDEGLIIVKVTDVAGTRRTLARMLFRMSQPVEVPENEASALAEIDRERKAKADEMLMGRLRAKAKIEYPMGERFKYVFWK